MFTGVLLAIWGMFASTQIGVSGKHLRTRKYPKITKKHPTGTYPDERLELSHSHGPLSCFFMGAGSHGHPKEVVQQKRRATQLWSPSDSCHHTGAPGAVVLQLKFHTRGFAS